MALIVKKFGGTSVKDTECLLRVAEIIAEDYNKGNDIVVVVSAQGDTTDELLCKAHDICKNSTLNRETDMLLSAGEQISASLLSMALLKLNILAISLLGWQAGILTNSNHTCAGIEYIDASRIKNELSQKKVVVVAGFQGIDQNGDITTLGRGGSDTSAVALACALKADLCQIYTDVSGVFTADPRIISTAKKSDTVPYTDIMQMATLGAQVMHNRSVELASNSKTELEVLSSIEKLCGTKIKDTDKLERRVISGVAKDLNTAVIYIKDLCTQNNSIYYIFKSLADNNITSDIISLPPVLKAEVNLSFTVPLDRLEQALSVINSQDVKFDEIISKTNVAKVSVIGTAMQSHCEIISEFFGALSACNVIPVMVALSEIRISAVVAKDMANTVLKTLHDTFVK